MKVWIITDTHWWQSGSKIDRPDNHTEYQFKQWIEKVNQEDLVIHVGDVTWKPILLADNLAALPGRKILVRGNHDKESLTWYMRRGFAFACDSFVFKKVLFTHEPAKELPSTAVLNVHGHLHANAHRKVKCCPECGGGGRLYDEEPYNHLGRRCPTCNGTGQVQEYKPQSWHRLLAIEHTHYAPVPFDKFVGQGRLE